MANRTQQMIRAFLTTIIALVIARPLYANQIAMLDFSIQLPTSGKISYNGGAKGGAPNPVIGKNIEVDSVKGINTFLNNNVSLYLIGGVLNFTSGPFVDTDHPAPITVIENIPTKETTTTTVMVKECDQKGKGCVMVPEKVTTTKTILVPTPVLVPQAPTKYFFGNGKDPQYTSIRLTSQCVDTDRDDFESANGKSIATSKCDKNDLLGPLDPLDKNHKKHLPLILLSGDWESVTVSSGLASLKIVSGSFDDTLSLGLVNFYGDKRVPKHFELDGTLNLGFDAQGKPPASFSSERVLSGGVTSTLPEPGTIALLGTGMLAAARLIKRRLTLEPVVAPENKSGPWTTVEPFAPAQRIETTARVSARPHYS